MSELDTPISPEIANSELSHYLQVLAERSSVRTILEIGSSSGLGSTRYLYDGIRRKEDARLFCLEISISRFELLAGRYSSDPRVTCLNMSSVRLDEFSTEEEVIAFYSEVPSKLNKYSAETILKWLRQDLEYIRHNMHEDVCGIEVIKEKYNIENFDMVLIDGSEFTGFVEFKKIYGANIIVLDDIDSFKNYYSNKALKADSQYSLIKESLDLRNGYSVFERSGEEFGYERKL